MNIIHIQTAKATNITMKKMKKAKYARAKRRKAKNRKMERIQIKSRLGSTLMDGSNNFKIKTRNKSQSQSKSKRNFRSKREEHQFHMMVIMKVIITTASPTRKINKSITSL